MQNRIDQKSVLECVKKIPKGKVVRYKDIAIYMGNPQASRVIGNMLNKNENIIKIPCHRVVKSNGEIGGYNHGIKIKRDLLKTEGIGIFKNRIQKLSQILYTFK